MKIIVAVVVYDRLQNVEEWIRCWKQCRKEGAELYIIHNYKNESQKHACRTFCENAGIRHIPRNNVGMDIGALQDVCRGRLEGFPNEWDYLFWVTDDVIPMSKNFIRKYLEIVKRPKIGVVCLELSREVKTHIRTTGFMISQKTASFIQFPSPTITSKAECYEFEHKGRNAFYEQIRGMGLSIIQVDPDLKKAPLWDTHIRANLRRQNEHLREFPQLEEKSINDKITIICPVYNRFPQIIGSCINQTHQNWELLLIHDGPNSTNLRNIVETIGGKRIKYIETEERKGLWGHPIRKWALENLDILSPNTGYVMITNDDNTIVPSGLEYLLSGFTDNSTVLTYPSKFVHAYLSPQPDGDHRYGTINTKPELGYIDCCCALIRKDVACAIGWHSMEYSSDWVFFKEIIDRYGVNNWRKVLGTLVNHN